MNHFVELWLTSRLTQRAPDPRQGAPGLAWWDASRRVFRQVSWLEVGSVKAALPRPAHQRVTPTVSPLKLLLRIQLVCHIYGGLAYERHLRRFINTQDRRRYRR